MKLSQRLILILAVNLALFSSLSFAAIDNPYLNEGENETDEFVDFGPQPDEAVESNWHLVLGAGLTFGGDSLVHTNRGSASSSITAGNFIVLNAGLLYRLPSTKAEFLVTYGWHNDEDNGLNASVDFLRRPLDMLAFYRISPKQRYGGGITYQSSIKLAFKNEDYPNEQFDFKDTFGAILQWDYFITPHLTAGVRLVHIDYQLKDYPESFSGNHIGFMTSYIF